MSEIYLACERVTGTSLYGAVSFVRRAVFLFTAGLVLEGLLLLIAPSVIIMNGYSNNIAVAVYNNNRRSDQHY